MAQWVGGAPDIRRVLGGRPASTSSANDRFSDLELVRRPVQHPFPGTRPGRPRRSPDAVGRHQVADRPVCALTPLRSGGGPRRRWYRPLRVSTRWLARCATSSPIWSSPGRRRIRFGRTAGTWSSSPCTPTGDVTGVDDVLRSWSASIADLQVRLAQLVPDRPPQERRDGRLLAGRGSAAELLPRVSPGCSAR
jgi:hypothetical protein